MVLRNSSLVDRNLLDIQFLEIDLSHSEFVCVPDVTDVARLSVEQGRCIRVDSDRVRSRDDRLVISSLPGPEGPFVSRRRLASMTIRSCFTTVERSAIP